jgi:hypothetical protein
MIALVIAAVAGCLIIILVWLAELTLAMGTHALSEICRALHLDVGQLNRDRLSAADVTTLCEAIENRNV